MRRQLKAPPSTTPAEDESSAKDVRGAEVRAPSSQVGEEAPGADTITGAPEVSGSTVEAEPVFTEDQPYPGSGLSDKSWEVFRRQLLLISRDCLASQRASKQLAREGRIARQNRARRAAHTMAKAKAAAQAAADADAREAEGRRRWEPTLRSKLPPASPLATVDARIGLRADAFDEIHLKEAAEAERRTLVLGGVEATVQRTAQRRMEMALFALRANRYTIQPTRVQPVAGYVPGFDRPRMHACLPRSIYPLWRQPGRQPMPPPHLRPWPMRAFSRRTLATTHSLARRM